MTDRLTAEAQVALDAVRARVGRMFIDPLDYPALAYTFHDILAVLENLDARLRALEGK